MVGLALYLDNCLSHFCFLNHFKISSVSLNKAPSLLSHGFITLASSHSIPIFSSYTLLLSAMFILAAHISFLCSCSLSSNDLIVIPMYSSFTFIFKFIMGIMYIPDLSLFSTLSLLFLNNSYIVGFLLGASFVPVFFAKDFITSSFKAVYRSGIYFRVLCCL